MKTTKLMYASKLTIGAVIRHGVDTHEITGLALGRKIGTRQMVKVTMRHTEKGYTSTTTCATDAAFRVIVES